MVVMKYSLGFMTLMFCAFHFSSQNDCNLLDKERADYMLTMNFQQTDLGKSITRGKEIYTDFCMQCHMADGKGDGKNFPPLDESDWLDKKTNESIHAIKFGLAGEILVNGQKFDNNMPEMGLSNQEVADVMNYIRNSWNNKNPKIITLKQVEAIDK